MDLEVVGHLVGVDLVPAESSMSRWVTLPFTLSTRGVVGAGVLDHIHCCLAERVVLGATPFTEAAYAQRRGMTERPNLDWAGFEGGAERERVTKAHRLIRQIGAPTLPLVTRTRAPGRLGWVSANRTVSDLGQLGFLYLMFIAGLELDLRLLRLHRRAAGGSRC